MHMGLAALGVASGDEVILADINWIASAAPVTYLGARPILVEVLRDTWCLDPKKVEAAITPRTKAIIAVHLYGNMSDMDRLRAIGSKYNLPIIEDAAEAIGSMWGRHRAGSMGLFGTLFLSRSLLKSGLVGKVKQHARLAKKSSQVACNWLD